ncbi:MAG: MFS transporter [Deltaproteobacteria bacterium]|nr:MFS transporter [Deltaproteobacteria bacterium]MCW5802144.1 MFS transporter [Deltaproteobacteria bacterium]
MNESTAHVVDETPPRATRREWIGLAVLALPCLLYAMDLTNLMLAVPHLTADLDPSSTQLLWIVDVYGFLVAGSLITMGTLGDRIGRRRLLMIGAVAFGAASVLAAFAPTAELLILARAVLGVAAATIAPSTLSLISNMFRDPKQRTVAVGVWVSSFSVGGALGPVVGGMLLEHFWWGSVFLLALPVMVLLLVLGPRLLPEFRDDNAGKLDVPSAGLSIAAVLAVIYGVKRIAAADPLPPSLLAIAAGVALALLFVRRQGRLAHPLLDLNLFRRRSFAICLTVYVLGAFAAFGTFLTLAQYLQLVAGLGPAAAGAWTAPSGAAFIAGSLVAPLLLRWMDKVHVLTLGLVISASGALTLTQVGATTSLALLLTGYLLFSFGMSLAFTHAVDLVVGSAPPERAGSASALAETGAELGGAVGIAILGSVATFLYRGAMATTAPPATPPEAMESLAGAVEAAQRLAGAHAAEVLATARDAFCRSLGITATVCALALVAASIATAALLPRERGKMPAVG